MLGIGWAELATLLVIGLIIFGPHRLPELTAKAVRTVRQFQAYIGVMQQEFRAAVQPQVQQWQELARLPEEEAALFTTRESSPARSAAGGQPGSMQVRLGLVDRAGIGGPCPTYQDAT